MGPAFFAFLAEKLGFLNPSETTSTLYTDQHSAPNSRSGAASDVCFFKCNGPFSHVCLGSRVLDLTMKS